MMLLLMGDGPGVAWVRAFLDESCAGYPTEMMPTIEVIDGPPTRQLLVSLLAGPIDVLILADYLPFADGAMMSVLPPIDAVRHEAQRAILALELARHATRTLVLARSDAEPWSASLALLQPDLLGAPVADQRSAPSTPPPAGVGAPASPPDTPLVATYLEPLFAATARTAPLVLTWPREAFLHGDDPNEVLPATIEVAGRVRILAYGPYLPLPMGSWHATAFLGFSPDIGKMPFIFEAVTGGAMTRGFFEVERGGIFTLELDFQVTDAMDPVELRLISQETALEGQVALIEVKLEQFTGS